MEFLKFNARLQINAVQGGISSSTQLHAYHLYIIVHRQIITNVPQLIIKHMLT